MDWLYEKNSLMWHACRRHVEGGRCLLLVSPNKTRRSSFFILMKSRRAKSDGFFWISSESSLTSYWEASTAPSRTAIGAVLVGRPLLRNAGFLPASPASHVGTEGAGLFLGGRPRLGFVDAEEDEDAEAALAADEGKDAVARLVGNGDTKDGAATGVEVALFGEVLVLVLVPASAPSDMMETDGPRGGRRKMEEVLEIRS
mmetsp:Transcript_34039/g.73805  ORF Transcript_34039/g.73805 Transcript_34039/m.73805 type:complete len:200 (+) Transcript_34039:1416-2015(+)